MEDCGSSIGSWHSNEEELWKEAGIIRASSKDHSPSTIYADRTIYIQANNIYIYAKFDACGVCYLFLHNFALELVGPFKA